MSTTLERMDSLPNKVGAVAAFISILGSLTTFGVYEIGIDNADEWALVGLLIGGLGVLFTLQAYIEKKKNRLMYS